MSSSSPSNTAAASAVTPAALAALTAATATPPPSPGLVTPASISPPTSPRTKKGQASSMSPVSAAAAKAKAIFSPSSPKYSSTLSPITLALLSQSLPPSSPKRGPRLHQRQRSAEPVSPSTSASSSTTSLPSSTSHLQYQQQHFPLYQPSFSHKHQRQHSHPQSLSPGPTATTLAQTPHRRHNTTGPISSSLFNNNNNNNNNNKSPSSPASTLTSPPTSPRFIIDSSSSNSSSSSIATTLPPLPIFQPLSPDLESNFTPVASEDQREPSQGDPAADTNTNTNTDTNANSDIITLHSQTTKPKAPTSNVIRSEPGSVLPSSPSLTGMLTSQSSASDAGSPAIPIPARSQSSNSNSNSSNSNSNSSNSNSSNSNCNSNSSSNSKGFFGSSVGSGSFWKINSSSSTTDGGNQSRQRRDSSQLTPNSKEIQTAGTGGGTGSNRNSLYLTPNPTGEGSSLKSDSSYLSSRRSSKDSSELMSGTTVEDLVDQLIDYANPQDLNTRAKVFLMIYRKFMRPRELLDMFIARFDSVADSAQEDDTEANNTRLRICSCLYTWFKEHPNDILHRQTRQRVAAFLRERVALYPALNEIYQSLQPLTSIHYFNNWRWPEHGDLIYPASKASSVSGAHVSASVSVASASDDESDIGFLDSNSIYSEEEMDEDREWGLMDEDEVISAESIHNINNINNNNAAATTTTNNNNLSVCNSIIASRKNSMNLDSLAAFAYLASFNNGNSTGCHSRNNSTSSSNNSTVGTSRPLSKTQSLFPPSQQYVSSRDRRSSTGSFVMVNSPCAMETYVAGRRGSASSVPSNSGPFGLQGQPSQQQQPPCFPEGDVLLPSSPQLHVMGPIPFISKRSSSQGYRQQQRHSMSHIQSISSNNTSLAGGQTAMHSAPISLFGSSSSGQQASQSTPSLTSAPLPVIEAGSTSGPLGPVVTATKVTTAPKDEDKVHPLSPAQLPLAKITGYHSWLLPGPPLSIVDQAAIAAYTAFMDLKDAAIADQLTLVEFVLFKRLKPRDMLRQVWKAKKGSAAFQACIGHFNFISSWVGTMILLPLKPKHRARVMEKFISVAKILRDMGNFNTTMAIIGAMNTSSIHRLAQTRELFQTKEAWNTFKELEHLMSAERSFFEYRAALRSIKGSCIPYLGVHLGDLFSISEGNKDFKQDGTLHWQKFVLMTDVISMVMAFIQQSETTYGKIQQDPAVAKVITETNVLDDEEQYKKSVGIEPSKLNHSRSLSKFALFG